MDDKQLRRLRDLHNLATTGPWEVTEDENGDGHTEIGIWAPKVGGIGEYVAENVTSTTARNDAEAIVEAHNRLPDLLAEVMRLRAQSSGWSTARNIVERALRKGYDIGGVELDDLAKAFGLNGGGGQC